MCFELDVTEAGNRDICSEGNIFTREGEERTPTTISSVGGLITEADDVRNGIDFRPIKKIIAIPSKDTILSRFVLGISWAHTWYWVRLLQCVEFAHGTNQHFEMMRSPRPFRELNTVVFKNQEKRNVDFQIFSVM
ncbi:hypothetical protein BCON_0176g00060 [Botryotinia convoluta]|uniref:Uncharacterized protein n=1 Tax=Botryotinia convoluta TaxID=54673 RepID=A0A4Z1HPH0_9HELO|nr:hypothetical protein BCON_0176g00060 [Botryotinia convoluta]